METTETQAANPAPQPPELNDLEKLLLTARTEWKHWLGTAAIAIVLITGIFLYRARSESNEENAGRMLGEARSTQALQSIMSQYSRTTAAKLALLQMAKIQYDAGDYVAALSSYTDFLSRNPTHLMASVAELGRIHCNEAMGQTADALVAFTAFAAKNPDHYLAPQALFGKARCLQQLARLPEARAVYEDFLAAHPKTPWKNDIEQALRQLDRESRKGSTASVSPNPLKQ